MGQRLTDKERAFCRYYIANGGNGTQAAISAGYASGSAKVTASQMLKKPQIRAEIELLRSQVDNGTLHLLAAPGGSQPPRQPPLDGQVLEPGSSGPRREPPATDPTVALTRGWIVGQLMRNVAISMGDETVEQRVMVKATRKTLKAGADGEPMIQETVDVVTVRVTDRSGSAANQALNLLDQQIDKIKAERGSVPQEATDFMAAHQDRLAAMRRNTKAAAKP
ncbi:MAG: terminase small subunit [Variibacter sp.]|nr:terminase small subunit [Variibacter sp.]